MTDRLAPALITETASRPVAMAQVVTQHAEAIAHASPGAQVATTVAETLAALVPLHQVSGLWVEVLRRDTAAAAMVVEAMDAFGQAPWPEASRGIFVFRHDWAEPLIERLQWATGVVRLASGNEARQALRHVPRRSITYHVGHGRAMDALVADWLEDHLGRVAWWPLPQHAARLRAAAAAGTFALDLTPPAGADVAAVASYRLDEGGVQREDAAPRAILCAADGWQVLSLAEPLARPVPVGALVLPLVEGVAVEPAEFAQGVPGLMAGRVTVQIAFEPLPDEGLLDDPWLDGLPVWPDGNWREDPSVTAQGEVTRQDLSPVDPWVRRDDPWPMSTFLRRYLATGREAITRWRARLYRAQGRLGACWLPDGLAPVLRVQAEAEVEAGYLRVDGAESAAFWHRPAAALIVHPDGTRQAVLTGPVHQDAGGVLVLRSGLDEAVPAGSRVLRLVRCRLDHDAVELYWPRPRRSRSR
ncbi:MAG: hypothetical protein ACOZB1_13505 [Pseudomonadota bacterium]|jgi:hypothetical protein